MPQDINLEMIKLVTEERKLRKARMNRAVIALAVGDVKAARKALTGHSDMPKAESDKFDVDISKCETAPTKEFVKELVPESSSRVYFDRITGYWFYSSSDITNAFGRDTSNVPAYGRIEPHSVTKIYGYKGVKATIYVLSERFNLNRNALRYREGCEYLFGQIKN